MISSSSLFIKSSSPLLHHLDSRLANIYSFLTQIPHFLSCVITCHLTNITRLISAHHCISWNNVKGIICQKHTERETGIGRKGVLVSRFCRDPVALCLDFLIVSVCCCSGRFNIPKCSYLMSCERNSAVSYLCDAFTAWTNTADSIFMLGSVNFAHKWPTAISFREILVTFILWVQFRACTSSLLLEQRSRISTYHPNICTSAWAVVTFATSGNKMTWLDMTW